MNDGQYVCKTIIITFHNINYSDPVVFTFVTEKYKFIIHYH